MDEQHNNIGIHQSTGGLALPPLEYDGVQTESVEWQSVPLSQCNAFSRKSDLGVDMLSMGMLLYGEWALHPTVVEQIWTRFERASVDLFASRENARCAQFSLQSTDVPLVVDVLACCFGRFLLWSQRYISCCVRNPGIVDGGLQIHSNPECLLICAWSLRG